MNLKFLETFIWVARLKSFSATAERMNATQAAISTRIATLEQDLGVRLLDRSGREVTLTSEGITALERAETIVRLTRKLRDDVSNPETLRETLRVGVIDTISHTWLVRLIDQVRCRYPNVRFQLHAETSLVIAEQLLRHELDLGLLMGPVIGDSVANIELCSYACIWVASPAFPIGTQPLTIPDLAAHPIISFPAASKPHQTLLRQFSQLVGEEVLLYTSNSLATITRMVVDGIGIAALPAILVERELTEGCLRALDVRPSFPPLPFHASYLETGHSLLPATVGAMAKGVADEFCASLRPDIAW